MLYAMNNSFSGKISILIGGCEPAASNCLIIELFEAIPLI